MAMAVKTNPDICRRGVVCQLNWVQPLPAQRVAKWTNSLAMDLCLCEISIFLTQILYIYIYKEADDFYPETIIIFVSSTEGICSLFFAVRSICKIKLI